MVAMLSEDGRGDCLLCVLICHGILVPSNLFVGNILMYLSKFRIGCMQVNLTGLPFPFFACLP